MGANIFAQFLQPVRSVDDYGADLDKRDLLRMQLLGVQRQNAAADAAAAQAVQRQNALQALYAANPDPVKLESAMLARPDFAEMGAGLRQKRVAAVETEAKAAKETQATQSAAFSDYMRQLSAIPDPETAKQLIAGGVSGGKMSTQLATAYSRMIDANPQAWRQNLALALASPDKSAELLMPHLQTVDLGGQKVTQAVNKQTGVPTNTGTMQTTQSPDNAAAQETARRGQNMADARSREKNAIDREAQQTQVINDPTRGPILVNKGTGLARQVVGLDGKPIQGETAAKTEAGLKKLQPVIDEAEKLINQSTGSYAGAAIDQAGRIVGTSTEGAKAVAQLKVLEGSLMMNQPRMEGPQSNADVMLYKQMAGQIGDPTVPNETKKAALDQIKRLNAKYLGAQAAAPAAAPSGFKIIKVE